MLTLYGDARSGNCYKAQLLLAQLGLPYRWVAVDILKKETRSPEFLAKNPNGKIPLLQLADGTYTHVAHEGNFDVDRFPATQRWLGRVRDQPGHVPMA